MLSGFSRLFREVPGVAPVAVVGAEFHGCVGGGDLVFGCGEGGTFGGVFAFAGDRTFGSVVHREPSGSSHHQLLQPSGQCSQRASIKGNLSSLQRASSADNVGLKGNSLAVLSWRVA